MIALGSDHAGLPLKTVLEQLDLLGGILPELRKGMAEGRPAHIPDAPTHASLVAAAGGSRDLTVHAEDMAGIDKPGLRHESVFQERHHAPRRPGRRMLARWNGGWHD